MNIDLIVADLKKRLNKIGFIESAFLFGSYAMNNFHDDSDLDVLIVLKQSGVHKTYMETVKNRILILKQIEDLTALVPIDLLVYTSEEWKHLCSDPGDFIKNILANSVVIK